MKFASARTPLLIVAALLYGALLLVYARHFDNSFHFDDHHTIVENPYIRSIANVPDFFTKGAETFGTTTSNQVYRPFVTTTLALDYWLSERFSEDGSGMHVEFYHGHMWVVFSLLLLVLFGILLKLQQRHFNGPYAPWLALFGTAFFAFHAVTAETMNYIISRSDLYSTFFTLLAFYVYVAYPQKRKYFLYLIPFVVGMFTKLTTAMFIPLIIVYSGLFEWEFKKPYKRKLLLNVAVAGLAGVLLGLFVLSRASDSFSPGGPDVATYAFTQIWVVLHYFISFFVPYHLSADAGQEFLTQWNDWRILNGLLVHVGLSTLVIISIFKKQLRMIAFGIAWFYLTLLPTSSVIALAEPLNDHRMFIAFPGLIISLLSLFYWHDKKFGWSTKAVTRYTFAALAVLLLASHAQATYQRNEVWDNDESLWADVVAKNPKHARGLMNYGLSLMAKGDYENALTQYDKALEINTEYSLLFINKAIVLKQLNRIAEAEEYYRKALICDRFRYEPDYYYAVFLHEQGRKSEAISHLHLAIEKSPSFIKAHYFALQIAAELQDWEAVQKCSKAILALNANDEYALAWQQQLGDDFNAINYWKKKAAQSGLVNDMISLSLAYYNTGDYSACIHTCEEILKEDAANATALNNICAAYNALRQWDKAIAYGERALEADGNFERARGNVNVAQYMKQLDAQLAQTSDANSLLNLSLNYYQQKDYVWCIKCCEKALKADANNEYAWNNICSAYNAMGEFEKAVEACEKALEINADMEVAKNNLDLSRQKRRINGH